MAAHFLCTEKKWTEVEWSKKMESWDFRIDTKSIFKVFYQEF